MRQGISLGVNIDHVATLRQVRHTDYPSPLHAAFEAVNAGADNITLHLREDRRHIQEIDLRLLRPVLPIPMNLEIAMTPFMIDFAMEIQPRMVCFVPEKREELTTEGGLDVIHHMDDIKQAVVQFRTLPIQVSLFIDPVIQQIDAARATGVTAVELHTGTYAEAKDEKTQHDALTCLEMSAQHAHDIGLIVHAGHGLHYHNVQAVAAIPVIHTLNIGHAIIARSLFCGLQTAVRDMKCMMQAARSDIPHRRLFC